MMRVISIVVAALVVILMAEGASAAKTLTITFAGAGTGNVSIIDTTDQTKNKVCTTTCTDSLGNNDVGTLSTSANSNSTFAGWSNATWTGSPTPCTGTNSPCNFSMGNSAQSVTVTFTLNPSPSIVSFAPPTPVNDTAGATRTFNITANQTVNVTWYINGTSVQTNTSTVVADYTNGSAALGVWNVTAIANNNNGSVSQQWLWNVSAPQGAPKTIDVTLSNVPVNFGDVSSGYSNQAALLPLNVTIQSTTNVNVNLTLNGSSFTYSTFSFGVGNLSYSNSSNGIKTAITSLFTPPLYADWVNITKLAITNRSIYFWISIPVGQEAGTYSSNVSVRVEEYI